MIWRGEIIKDGNVWSYKVGEEGIPSCSGCAQAYLEGGMEQRFTEFMSWGYEGKGSELTAAHLIRHSIGGSLGRQLAPVLAQAFAREVIDHLPDEWAMDKNEVVEWVKKKEKK